MTGDDHISTAISRYEVGGAPLQEPQMTVATALQCIAGGSVAFEEALRQSPQNEVELQRAVDLAEQMSIALPVVMKNSFA